VHNREPIVFSGRVLTGKQRGTSPRPPGSPPPIAGRQGLSFVAGTDEKASAARFPIPQKPEIGEAMGNQRGQGSCGRLETVAFAPACDLETIIHASVQPRLCDNQMGRPDLYTEKFQTHYFMYHIHVFTQLLWTLFLIVHSDRQDQ